MRTTAEPLPISVEYILSLISYLDDTGIPALDHRSLAILSGTILVLIRHFAGERGGIEWHSYIHALITGIGASMCIYLNFYAVEIAGGSPEPLRTIRCEGPLTSLHKILPAITLGYSVCDILNGFAMGKIDFILHGLVTSIGSLIGCVGKIESIATQLLLMEVSTIFLCMTKVTIFGDIGALIIQGTFALSFLITRNIISPYFWWLIVWTYFKEYEAKLGDVCISKILIGAVIVIGGFFHLLNLFWMYKIIKKIQRKLSGKENIQNAKME